MEHNPDNLTTDQIGNGYRLLTLEEVESAIPSTGEIDVWWNDGWKCATEEIEGLTYLTFRTNMSPELFKKLSEDRLQQRIEYMEWLDDDRD